MQHGRKQARFHGKTDKTGSTVGRPSCQSSLLSDPNAKFSVEMQQKPPRTRKETRNGGTVAPSRQTKKNGDPTEEGRPVGLDFDDLLIEALKTRSMSAMAI